MKFVKLIKQETLNLIHKMGWPKRTHVLWDKNGLHSLHQQPKRNIHLLNLSHDYIQHAPWKINISEIDLTMTVYKNTYYPALNTKDKYVLSNHWKLPQPWTKLSSLYKNRISILRIRFIEGRHIHTYTTIEHSSIFTIEILTRLHF